MGKYLVKRLIHGAVSIVIVVIIVMIMIYSILDRMQVFASDPLFSRQTNNARTTYIYSKWEEYGYVDYVTYAEWLQQKTTDGEIDEETRAKAVGIAQTSDKDSKVVAQYVEEFTRFYEDQGYEVQRLDAVMSAWPTAASRRCSPAVTSRCWTG